MPIRFLCALTAALLLCGCATSLPFRRQLDATVSDRQVTVRTPRLEAVIEDGRIVSCRSRLDDSFFAAPGYDAGAAPAGLGCLGDDVEALRRLHVPWGEVTLNQHINDQAFSIYLHPDGLSEFTASRQGAAWVLTWTNLTNGQKRFPDCSLTLTLDLDRNGALRLQSAGTAPQGGIFGIQTPLANINPEVEFVLPHFGGMRFRHAPREALCPFGGAPFWEAPVAALEFGASAMGIWMENETCAPYYAYFKNGPRGFSFSFEPNPLMPVEDKRQFTAMPVKIDIFPGDWKAALAPYRNWYRHHYAADLARRDAPSWADDIKLVIDMGGNYENVAKTFPPETVMYHNWNARAPQFDRELPDWTPRAGYVDSVKTIRSFGFRTMAYVNTYCINFQSPVFTRDNIADFFLTRKNSLWRYNSQAANASAHLGDMLIGTVNQATAQDQFAGIEPGKLLYGDPLSPGWRRYHAESMQVWNSTTGTDANYEDTAGCVNDHGNGIVDGLAAGQGSVAQMQLLQKTQPHVPMASEYGPEGIAFAVKWPLNYAQVWGGEGFRRARLHRHEPVTGFLFGYTAWVPIIRCEDDFNRHLVTACSDALGGMGMLNGSFADPDSGGMSAHLTRRALLFTGKRLKPVFTEKPYPKHIRCLYQGTDGLYQYYDDGTLQQMLGPDGKAVYGRLNGARAYQGELTLPGWPLGDDQGIFGLNPALSYALEPARPGGPLPLVITKLPEHVSLVRYYAQENFAYLELDSDQAGEIAFELFCADDFDHLYVNDHRQPAAASNTCRGTLPMRILACRTAPPVAEGKPIGNPATPVHNIGATGLYEGTPVTLESLPHRRNLGGQPAYFVNFFQDRQMDWLVRVPAADSALRLFFKNFSDRYGNACRVKLLVNGKLLYSHDYQKPNPDYSPEAKNAKMLWDTALHELTVPLGAHAGQTVLVSVAIDDKQDRNSDNQSISIPLLIRTPNQELTDRILP